MNSKEHFVKDLTKILISQGVIHEKEARGLQEAFSKSSQERFDYFLLDEGFVEKEDLLKALEQYYQTPAIDLSGYLFETFILRKFPKGVMMRNLFIPLSIDQNFMILAAADPSNPELLSIIGKYVSYHLEFRVALAQQIINSIQEFYDESVIEAGEEEEAYDVYGDLNVYEIGADQEYSSPGEEED